MADDARLCPSCRREYAAEVLFCPRDGSPLVAPDAGVAGSADPYLGQLVADQLRIERLVGVGAMGRVYRAHQLGVDRPVAVKILHRHLMSDAAVSARFLREARVASRLMHPNVVQVLMTGELPASGTAAGGEPYLVMEFLDGVSLHSALAASGGALPLPRALHVMLQVCDAVGEAHAQGVVHRDLKPDNVMLVRRGDDGDFAKVLDFGLCRVASSDAAVATRAGAIFGTAPYVSPEGARGEAVTPASDVYALATILFQCLSGRTPFVGDDAISILIQHTSTPAPDLRELERSRYVPEPLCRVVARGLAKEPQQRPPHARELGRALLDAARSAGMDAGELITRSPLLGEGGGPTVWRSLESTRELELSPTVAAQQAAPRSAEASGDGSGRALDRSRPRSRAVWPGVALAVFAVGLLLAWIAGRATVQGGPVTRTFAQPPSPASASALPGLTPGTTGRAASPPGERAHGAAGVAAGGTRGGGGGSP